MKIEKISDTQIRCTLNKDDLANRHLRISELAYGSEKARALFRDLMQQASAELGFEAENIPLMIEAIPVSSDCLILQVTKVENPDELDTRFSNFTPAEDTEEEDEDLLSLGDEAESYADEILHCFEHLTDILKKHQPNFDEFSSNAAGHKEPKASEQLTAEAEADIAAPEATPVPLAKAFSFRSLSEVTELAAVIAPFYHGTNTVYKNPKDGSYHLVIEMSSHKPSDFNKIYNIIFEYGTPEHFQTATAAFYEEHMECIVRDRAVQILSKL